MAVADLETPVSGQGLDFFEQPGFANAGHAGQEDYARMTRKCFLKAVGKPIKLVMATHKRRYCFC